MINNSFKKKTIKLRELSKKINLIENKKSNLENAQNIYYPTFSDSIGLFQIFKLFEFKINYLDFYIKILKNTFSGIFFSYSRIFNKKNNLNYENIIFTWANYKNFSQNGSLNDRFFNINSRQTKNTLWVVVYSDRKIPKLLDKNILIYKNFKNKFKISKFIFFIFKKILSFRNLNFFFHNISNFSFFGDNFFKDIKKYLKPEIKRIFLPFEFQPFQNKIIYHLKKKAIQTKVIGYIHAPPLSFPSNYIYRKISPDEIIVNGKDQYICFSKFLNWPKERIKIKPSTRFLNNKKIFMGNKIYFPMTIRNEKKVYESLSFIINSNKFCLKGIEIRKHPVTAKEKKVVKFEKKLKKLLLAEKIKKIKNFKNLSIFIGSTGAIIEALERGIEVLQICEYPLLDVYSNELWKNIVVSKIDKNIYTYKIKKKGRLIRLGNPQKRKTLYGYKI
jgi:hypothetical protein